MNCARPKCQHPEGVHEPVEGQALPGPCWACEDCPGFAVHGDTLRDAMKDPSKEFDLSDDTDQGVTIMTQFTAHLTEEELSCHDGTPYPFDNVDSEDPQNRTWRVTRAEPLGALFEALRAGCGGSAITIDSAYRTIAYDTKLYDADHGAGNVAPPQGSQHPKGRALDLKHSKLSPLAFFNKIMQLYEAGMLPWLGGCGLYPTFVHVDVRARPKADGTPTGGHLAIWGGTRPSNVA